MNIFSSGRQTADMTKEGKLVLVQVVEFKLKTAKEPQCLLPSVTSIEAAYRNESKVFTTYINHRREFPRSEPHEGMNKVTSLLVYL